MESPPRKFHILKVLWLLVPAAFVLRFVYHDEGTWLFVCAAVGIIPLAGMMGHATEQLSHRAGPTIGGLLNATLGNAAELIIAILALREGLIDVVKASITGSIIGNILFVFGLSALLGGIGREKQRFSRTAAEQGVAMLFLSVAGLVMPAIYHFAVKIHDLNKDMSQEAEEQVLLKMSTGISIVLILTYFAGLYFSLKTHKHLYFEEEEAEHDHKLEPLGWTIFKLVLSAVLISFLAEFLVGTVEHTTEALGWTPTFVGVVIIAIVGNAAEHSSAINFAMKDNLNLSLTIAVESSKQVALFVAPVLVLLSYLFTKQMDLRFTFIEVAGIWISVTTVGLLALDGESNWMEGFQLLAVYVILGVAFFFV
ncbi:MAG: calcium/proton exchanger [Planctomycetota bacterium]